MLMCIFYKILLDILNWEIDEASMQNVEYRIFQLLDHLMGMVL